MSMENERIIKTQEEIEYIKKAVEIIDDVYDYILQTIKKGDTEIEVARRIYDKIIELGGEGTSFDTIVAFGKNGAEPHHVPTDDKLEEGMLVTIDMGAKYNGYCSDFTRTFGYGQLSDKQIKIYDIVYNSQLRALNAVKPNVNCFDVDLIARKYIEANGYGPYYIHGTGHGVGLEIHEAPYLNTKTNEVLDNNMVVTIEPGIYLPNEMGVRIEDVIIVGEGKKMSRHDTKLIVL